MTRVPIENIQRQYQNTYYAGVSLPYTDCTANFDMSTRTIYKICISSVGEKEDREIGSRARLTSTFLMPFAQFNIMQYNH